jgi:hypothetical protein
LFGAAIHVTLVADARWDEVLPALAATESTVLEAVAIEPSLEDVFLDLLDREPPAHG